MIEKPFQIALAVSAVAHSLIFLSLGPVSLMHKPGNDHIKVAYLKNPPPAPSEPKPVVKKELIEVKNRLRNTDKMIAAAAVNRSEFTRRQQEAQSTMPHGAAEYLPKPVSMQESFPTFKKRVTLPPLETGKIKNPSYNGYYELIREKIRHAAYQNYGQTEMGEVYLAFVIGSDGGLKDVRYIDDKSTPSYYLKDISLRSIKDAGPFPPFPKELDYPQLSFNVIISFQIDG